MLTGSCDILKPSLFNIGNEKLKKYSDSDWLRVFRELKYQTVAVLPAYNLDALHLSDGARNKWQNYIDRQQIAFYHLVEVQGRVVSLLESNDISYVILKGLAAGQYYPHPELRMYGDIDILVAPEDFERSQTVLADHGCELMGDNGRHIEYSYEFVDVELHRFFSQRQIDGSGKSFDEFLISAISRAVKCEVSDTFFFCLPELENGLVLLYHIKQHLSTGLGLRQIIDWMMYVNREVDDDYWKTTFGPAAKSFGLDRLAVTVTRMCQIYLGLSDRITWCKDADEEICREVMDHISEHGNFGVKDRKDSKQTMQVLLDGNIFMRLQRQGLVHWKAAEEHSFLKPFAWLYQICRYIHLGFKREKPIASLIRDIKDSRHRKKLYRELGI